jgi:hypothetical protein
MTRKSIFRDFIAALRKRWKTEYPFIRSIDEARGMLPKASTFYAGVIKDTGIHVFLNFQHSCKSWEVGQFTINVVLSSDEYNPKVGMATCSALDLGEGSHRIGHLLGPKDKWWHLKQDDDGILTQTWRPSNYENADEVISEAVDDVTRDVLSAMTLLDVPMEAKILP